MRSFTTLGVVAVCAATISQESAQPSGTTGETLFDLCSPGGNNVATYSCAMYIRGFLDGYSARQETICFPENLTVGEAIAAFVRLWRSLEARKGAANMGPIAQAPSAYAFTVMMMDAYPCKPSR
jgi:hypothetical protein